MVVKTVFFVSIGHLWRNNFLFRKLFKNFSCFQRKTFSCFWRKKILLGCQNCFQVSRGFFRKSFFYENKFLELFLYFWSSSASFLDFWRKFCDRFVKTAFFVSSGDFWLDCFFYENLRVFSPSSGSEEKILAFWRQNIKKFDKTALYVYKKFLWIIWFLKKLLQFFRVLIKIFPHSRQNFEYEKNFEYGYIFPRKKFMPS